jgi:hypothetical protein
VKKKRDIVNVKARPEILFVGISQEYIYFILYKNSKLTSQNYENIGFPLENTTPNNTSVFTEVKYTDYSRCMV